MKSAIAALWASIWRRSAFLTRISGSTFTFFVQVYKFVRRCCARAAAGSYECNGATVHLGNRKYIAGAVAFECDSRAQLHAEDMLELPNVKGGVGTEL